MVSGQWSVVSGQWSTVLVLCCTHRPPTTDRNVRSCCNRREVYLFMTPLPGVELRSAKADTSAADGIETEREPRSWPPCRRPVRYPPWIESRPTPARTPSDRVPRSGPSTEAVLQGGPYPTSPRDCTRPGRQIKKSRLGLKYGCVTECELFPAVPCLARRTKRRAGNHDE